MQLENFPNDGILIATKIDEEFSLECLRNDLESYLDHLVKT